MPSRSNAENMDATDRNGNRTGPRPKVGPADPETRRRMIQQRLNETQPVSSTTPPARAKRQTETPKRDLVRRYGPNGKTIDEIIGD